MKVLLDHCVPRPFERLLSGYETIHTSRLGWGELQNGRLLLAAEAEGFPVMITVDRNMQFQQNMTGRTLLVISLRVPSNDLRTLGEMVGLVQERLPNLRPGRFYTLVHPEMG